MTEHSDRHRFFHAMVVMGSSLALGCGGQTSQGQAGSGGSAEDVGGSGGSTSGGRQTAGGSTSGGSTGAGGLIIAPPSSGGSAELPAYPCALAQLDCPNPICYGDGFQIPNGCSCNSERPASAADCAPGETLACQLGTTAADGRPLANAVPFACTCVPTADCHQVCDAMGSPSRLGECTTDARGILCGCALIVLR